MEPETIAGVLSSLVFQEGKDESKPSKHNELNEGHKAILEIARKVCWVMVECKIDVKEEDFIGQFRSDMMDVTYEWCKGRSFSDICKMTDIFEGTIIWCFKRVEELLKQIGLVAWTKMENHELAEKMDIANEKLKRGIVFSLSLYL